MSDDIDRILQESGEGLGEEGSGELTLPETADIGAAPTEDRATGGAGRRLVGLLALILGIGGSVLAVLLAGVMIRVGFTASDTTDRAMEPVVAAFDRLDERVDQTDDLVDPEGIDPDEMGELSARIDGLVDVATGAHQGFEAIDDDPLYGLLPAELSTLRGELADFEDSATTIDDAMGSSSTVSPATAKRISDELDGMQSRMSDVRSMINDATTSLRRWLRFGSFLGFLGSLLILWGQVSLSRRGWRGSRARAI